MPPISEWKTETLYPSDFFAIPHGSCHSLQNHDAGGDQSSGGGECLAAEVHPSRKFEQRGCKAALLCCLLLGAERASASGPPGISIKKGGLPVPAMLEWATLGATADGAVINDHVLVLWAVR